MMIYYLRSGKPVRVVSTKIEILEIFYFISAPFLYFVDWEKSNVHIISIQLPAMQRSSNESHRESRANDKIYTI